MHAYHKDIHLHCIVYRGFGLNDLFIYEIHDLFVVPTTQVCAQLRN